MCSECVRERLFVNALNARVREHEIVFWRAPRMSFFCPPAGGLIREIVFFDPPGFFLPLYGVGPGRRPRGRKTDSYDPLFLKL